MLLYDARGQPVHLDRRIGGGGEGDVYLVAGRTGTVAKVYAKPTAHLRDKLTWMIDHPPDARQEGGSCRDWQDSHPADRYRRARAGH